MTPADAKAKLAENDYPAHYIAGMTRAVLTPVITFLDRGEPVPAEMIELMKEIVALCNAL